jgi:hypothetical protein
MAQAGGCPLPDFTVEKIKAVKIVIGNYPSSAGSDGNLGNAMHIFERHYGQGGSTDTRSCERPGKRVWIVDDRLI